MRRLVDVLSSLKLTLVLLVVLAAFFLLGLVVPQKAVLQRELYEGWQRGSPALVAVLEAVGLTDIHRSPVAIVIWAVFFVNLAAVMASRTANTARRVRIDGPVPDPAAAPGFPVRVALPASDGGLSTAERFFEGRGFAVHADGARLRAVQHRFGPVATLVFHLSFFVIAIGAGLSIATRFEGNVDLGEGEQFTGALEQYSPPPRVRRFAEAPRVRFIVEQIEQEAVGMIPTRLRVRVRDEQNLLRTFEINDPYEAGGASFVFRNLGVAPLLVVRDAAGEEKFAGFVRLDVLGGKKESFTLVGQKFEAEFFPDYFREGDAEGTRSGELRDPVLRLTVTHPSGRSKSASLRPGEAMKLGPYEVAFEDLRYWVRLYVRSERGLWLLWTGFALASLALGWRLFLYRREYVAEATTGEGGPVLHVAARAEFYRALFADEAGALLRELERALAERPGAEA